MRFNDPLRTHVFGSAPNKRKPCHPLGNDHISLPSQIEVDDFFLFPFWWDMFVSSLEASFSKMFFLFLFLDVFVVTFSPMLRSLSCLNLLEVYTYTKQSVSVSIIKVMLFSFVSFQPAVMLKDDIANVGSRP